MARSKEKPLEGRRLPGATGVPREIIDEGRNPNSEGAPRSVQAGVVRERPEKRARGAPHPYAAQQL
eukprot:5095057-Alexandrium_andersonii.AAC.1